jgi:hypothetical protein
MSSSAVFGDELDALGIWWPRGDGDALREAAATWTSMADLLDDVAMVLDAASKSAIENYRGDAANRFGELWTHWSGATGYLGITVADCRRLAAALTDFGTDVDVADRALVQLIEEALAANGLGSTSGMVDMWLNWLRDSAGVVGTDLALRADRSTDLLASVEPVQQPNAPTVNNPAPIDPAVIQPDKITWPDPGTPGDLSSLATTDVDFGAGQGRLPVVITPGTTAPGTTPLPSTPLPAAPAPLSGFGQSAPVTVVINGNGNTVNVGATMPSAFNTIPDPVPAMTLALDPLPPLSDPPPSLDPVPATDFLGGGGGSGFSGGGALPSFDLPPIDSTLSALPTLPALPEIAPLVSAAPVPITIRPPGLAGASIGAAAAAGIGAVAAKARGSKTPFFPMMPMGGGAGSGGDDGQEPKRRVRRR